MEPVTFWNGRRALAAENQKINLHPIDAPISLHATNPMPASANLCLITTDPITSVVAHLQRLKIPIVGDPVRRAGATGPIASGYFRDPDGNLIGVSEYERKG